MESKETRYCAKCCVAFHPHYGRPKQAFCSTACYLLNRWGNKQVPVCAICGKPANSTGQRKQKFCSVMCRIAGQIGKPNVGRSNRITKQCVQCLKDFSRPATNFHSVKPFCSRSCMAEWQSEFMRGPAHPRWKGGTLKRTYGIGWRRAKANALKRSGGICERCKKKPVKHIHHMLPVRYFARLQDAHFDKNLLAVCYRCHAREHRRLNVALPLLDRLQLQR